MPVALLLLLLVVVVVVLLVVVVVVEGVGRAGCTQGVGKGRRLAVLVAQLGVAGEGRGSNGSS